MTLYHDTSTTPSYPTILHLASTPRRPRRIPLGLGQVHERLPSTQIMPLVPNKPPSMPHSSCRLMVVGEAPGSDEEQCLEPFVGSSGKLLRSTLGQFGLAAEQCYLANICQHRPPNNDITSFDWDGPEIQSGLRQLQLDIDAYQPNCILSLGRTPMRALRPDLCYATKPTKANPDGLVIPISSWRGSVTTSESGRKLCFSFHPAYILRVATDLPYFKFDIARAVEQSRFPESRRVQRVGNLTPTLSELIDYLNYLRRNSLSASLDIEGYPNDAGITRLSICPTPTTGISIPFKYKGDHYWSGSEEPIVWAALADYLADASCLKTMHNGFYEVFVFAWKHRCIINGWSDDTMLKFWELYPELEKNLGVVNSFCTLEPYYKDDRESSNPKTELEYNFKDSAVTEESNRALEVTLTNCPASYQHYRFNISIASAISYLNLRGCRLDIGKLEDHTRRTMGELEVLQQAVDAALGGPALTTGVLTRKRKSDPWTFNVKSTSQKQWLLYTHLGYKPNGRWGPVTDEETLLHYYVKHKDPTLLAVIRAVRKRTRLQDIAKLVWDSDGRIRTSLDLVGTNTGRLSSRESMAMRPSGKDDGSWKNTGTNLQNVTKELRDCFVPDSDDYDFWQFDLRGADAWTVGVDLAALGYPAMLEDMLAGIKPSKVLMALLQEYEAGRNPATINNMTRPHLKKHLDTIIIPDPGLRDSVGRPADWKYDVCKKVQHGTNYDAKPDTISALVFVDSDGLVELSAQHAAVYQMLYKMRYRPECRNDWIKKQLVATGSLVSACGIKRKFFGIRNPRDPDPEIVRQASAFEPQANTTYCTNAALKNLWLDPSNRQSTGWLHCDPLLQVHDALAGQNHSSIREWAHRKLRGYFNTSLSIHGINVLIPADGGYGRNWQDTKGKLLA